MRWKFTLLLAFLAASLHGQNLINSYRFGTGSTLNTGLISYWKLAEASGNRVDSEPNGTPQDLTDINTVTSGTGIIGNAALFQSDNQELLQHADSADLSVGNIDFTIAVWAKAVTLTNDMMLASHYDVTGNQRSWRLWFNSGDGKFDFTVSNNGTAITNIQATTFGLPLTNVWHLVVASHDAVNDRINISVDAGTVNSLIYNSGVFDSSGLFMIGARPTTGWWNGYLQLVGLWKKVLTSAEITALYRWGNCSRCLLSILNMFPSKSSKYFRDGSGSYGENSSYFPKFHPALSHLSYLCNVLFRKLGSIMTFTSSHSSLLSCVSNVISIGSQKEVGWINASWIVPSGTVMANEHSFWNWSIVKLPRKHAWSGSFVKLIPHSSVSKIGLCCPEPTGFSFSNSLPKAFEQWTKPGVILNNRVAGMTAILSELLFCCMPKWLLTLGTNSINVPLHRCFPFDYRDAARPVATNHVASSLLQ